MSFWIFMLFALSLVPVIMIISGRIMWKFCPERKNPLLGYRTARSTSTPEAWDFANRYCGHLYEKIGWSMLIFPAVVLLLLVKSAQHVIADTGAVILLLQCLFLLLPIIPTERELKKKFGNQGLEK